MVGAQPRMCLVRLADQRETRGACKKSNSFHNRGPSGLEYLHEHCTHDRSLDSSNCQRFVSTAASCQLPVASCQPTRSWITRLSKQMSMLRCYGDGQLVLIALIM